MAFVSLSKESFVSTWEKTIKGKPKNKITNIVILKGILLLVCYYKGEEK